MVEVIGVPLIQAAVIRAEKARFSAALLSNFPHCSRLWDVTNLSPYNRLPTRHISTADPELASGYSASTLGSRAGIPFRYSGDLRRGLHKESIKAFFKNRMRLGLLTKVLRATQRKYQRAGFYVSPCKMRGIDHPSTKEY